PWPPWSTGFVGASAPRPPCRIGAPRDPSIRLDRAMRLVETDTALADDDLPERPRPPRPEHRKTYVSLLVTGAVLITTVALVYVRFPKRDHEVIGSVIDHHEDPGAFDLVRPSRGELAAWSLGVFGRSAPWPDDEG